MTDEEIQAALDDIALRPVCDFSPYELGFIGSVLSKWAAEGTLEDWMEQILTNVAAAREGIAAEREASGARVWSHEHPKYRARPRHQPS